MLREKSEEKNERKNKMILYQKESCDTYVDNYLFVISVGFSLSNNKMAFTLNLPLDAKSEIENINLLTRQLATTQDFLHQISELGKIVKIVFLDENSFCLVKGVVFNWLDLEEEIVEIIKDSYKDKEIEVYQVPFGKAEREMVEVVREYSGQRFSELVFEESLSCLKKDFGI